MVLNICLVSVWYFMWKGPYSFTLNSLVSAPFANVALLKHLCKECWHTVLSGYKTTYASGESNLLKVSKVDFKQKSPLVQALQNHDDK